MCCTVWHCTDGIFLGSLHLQCAASTVPSSYLVSSDMYQSIKCCGLTALLLLCCRAVAAAAAAAAAAAVMQVIILDIRYPSVPITQLTRHHSCVNALAWAPHSASHLCTAGDDAQVLFNGSITTCTCMRTCTPTLGLRDLMPAMHWQSWSCVVCIVCIVCMDRTALRELHVLMLFASSSGH